jgi:hypothetical protein
MKKAVFNTLGMLAITLMGLPAHAYTPHLKMPPKWPLPADRLQVVRDSEGRITRLMLADGDTVLYTHPSNGTVERVRFEDSNHDGRLQSGKESLLQLGHSQMFASSVLSSDRLRLTTPKLQALVQPVRADEDYPRYLEELATDFLSPANTASLSKVALSALEHQLDLLETCAPEAAHALRALLLAGRIRHSPDCPEAAIADTRDGGVIYLSGPWVKALEGHSSFTPIAHFMQSQAVEAREIRRRYFGSSSVSLESLGTPSRTWLFLLGLVHELGHIVQFEDLERYTMARDLYTFDLVGLTRIMQAQAPFGGVSRGYPERHAELFTRMTGWKQSVESGATYFALDSLAGCPADLGDDVIPFWQ